jgi:4-amino-4-deoxy-L-arabinose transferase-like glycosyltransferase
MEIRNKRLKIFSRLIRELPARSTIHHLILLLVVGFALRLFVGQTVVGGFSREYEGDEAGYVGLAAHVVQGMGFSDNAGAPRSYRMPGLPLLVAIPVSFTGENVIGIRIFMCFLESLLIPAFYLLVRTLTGSAKLGLIGGAIAIFFPTWVIPPGNVMTDIPAAILIVLITWMLIEGHRHQSLSWIVGAGLLWGAATLTRAGTLMYAPAIVLWLLLMMPDWKMRLASIVAVTISFAVVLAPWSIRNAYVHGKFVPLSTQGGVQLYISNNPEATGVMVIDQAYVDQTRAQRYPNFSEAERDELFQAEAVKFIGENPRRFVELCLIRFVQLWKLYSARVPLSNSLVMIASFGIALPFFLIQVIRCGWRRRPEMLFLLIILCHTGLHMVYGSIVRYRIPIEPLVVVMAISGFSWTLSRFRYGYSENTSRLSLKVT